MSTGATTTPVSSTDDDAREAEPRASRRGPVRGLAVWVLATLVVSAVTGLLWARLADPADWVVTDRGLLLSEEASTSQVAVELLYVALGAVVSFVVAAVGTARLRRSGWVVVPVAALTSLAGALVAWQVGVRTGPAGPDHVSGSVAPGDLVPARLEIDSWGAFLVWPVAALLAVVIVVWVTDRPRHAGVERRPDVSASEEPRAHS